MIQFLQTKNGACRVAGTGWTGMASGELPDVADGLKRGAAYRETDLLLSVSSNPCLPLPVAPPVGLYLT